MIPRDPTEDPPGRRGRSRRSRRATAAPGQIVALPTDTVYGIAADLALPDAIERLFAAKRRPPEKAVAVLLADAGQATTVGRPGPRGPGARATGSGPVV